MRRYPHEFGAATACMEIGNLPSVIKDYTEVCKELDRTKTTWAAAEASSKPGSTRKRPTKRPGRIPLVGSRVDAIEHLEAKAEALKKEIEAIRAAVGEREHAAVDEAARPAAHGNAAVALLTTGLGRVTNGAKALTNVVLNKQDVAVSTAGFVTFKTLAAASAAAQTTHAVLPDTVTVELAPEPREVYWPGVIMTPKVRASQGRVVSLLTVGLCFAYVFPVLFVSSLGDLESVAKQDGMDWMEDWVEDLDPFWLGLIQGLLPVLLLMGLMALVRQNDRHTLP